MGILDIFERAFIPFKRPTEVKLKEIVCKPMQKNLLKTVRTAAVGCEYSNVDGSERQAAIQKLKPGQRVRLIWDAGEDGSKKTVYLVRGSNSQQFSMSDCFGRLNDKMAAEIIQGLTQAKTVAAVRVAKIVGGTRKRPKLGCVLEVDTYRVTEKDKI